MRFFFPWSFPMAKPYRKAPPPKSAALPRTSGGRVGFESHTPLRSGETVSTLFARDSFGEEVRISKLTVSVPRLGRCRNVAQSGFESHSKLLSSSFSPPPNKKRHQGARFCKGGGGEIRTHGALSSTTVFKTVPLNHSGTPPYIHFCSNVGFRA